MNQELKDALSTAVLLRSSIRYNLVMARLKAKAGKVMMDAKAWNGADDSLYDLILYGVRLKADAQDLRRTVKEDLTTYCFLIAQVYEATKMDNEPIAIGFEIFSIYGHPVSWVDFSESIAAMNHFSETVLNREVSTWLRIPKIL